LLSLLHPLAAGPWPEIISYPNPSCCFTESMSPSTQRLVILSPSIAKKAAPDHEISRPEGAIPIG
jgi:hypothetical protein